MRSLKAIVRSPLVLTHRRHSFPLNRSTDLLEFEGLQRHQKRKWSSLFSIFSPLFHTIGGRHQRAPLQEQKRAMVTTADDSSSARITSSHYEAHSKAESYEDAYFYEPGAYMEHLVRLVKDRLQLSSNQPAQPLSATEGNIGPRPRCILDIGGGTGNFAQALVQQTGNSARFVVIDPFLDPTTSADDDSDRDSKQLVSFVKAPAEDFLDAPSKDCWRTQTIDHKFGGYDQILLKEVVHHFEKKDRIGIFRGMREGLRDQSSLRIQPSLLILTRPQRDIDYPLWDEARDVWKANQPCIEEIQKELREAGYTHLEWSIEAYPCSISLERWQSMVQNRFWSTFSNFSDQELKEACETIAQDYATNSKDSILGFEDRLIYLTAS